MLSASPIIESSLRLRTRADVAACLGRIGALFRSRVSVELDLALLLAWFKRQDLVELGYSSFRAFCSERVDWSPSWLGDLVRLVESPLDAVKQAVAGGLVPLSLAIRAPRRIEVADQARWL